jgi:hypothetical protein
MTSNIILKGYIANSLIHSPTGSIIGGIEVIEQNFPIFSSRYENMCRVIINVNNVHYGLDFINRKNLRMFFGNERITFREMIHKDIGSSWEYVTATEEEKNSSSYWESLYYAFPV